MELDSAISIDLFHSDGGIVAVAICCGISLILIFSFITEAALIEWRSGIFSAGDRYEAEKNEWNNKWKFI